MKAKRLVKKESDSEAVRQSVLRKAEMTNACNRARHEQSLRSQLSENFQERRDRELARLPSNGGPIAHVAGGIRDCGASDRVCGKRLRALLPILLPALERNGYSALQR